MANKQRTKTEIFSDYCPVVQEYVEIERHTLEILHPQTGMFARAGVGREYFNCDNSDLADCPYRTNHYACPFYA
ncbi:MAG: hypothetical protein HFE90_06945 [Firmicutes bacterium]|nr:hypothetical protein [Bacillota bacterium]